MAHLISISRPKCPCGKWSTVILRNQYNGVIGSYCNSCGKRELRAVEKREKEYEDYCIVRKVLDD